MTMRFPSKVLLLALLFIIVSTPAFAWWSDGVGTWQKRYPINASVTTINFRPFELIINSSYINMSDCQGNGGDVRIVNASDNGVVAFNLYSWNSTEGLIYVNVSLESSNWTGYLYCNTTTNQTTTSVSIDEVTISKNTNHCYGMSSLSNNVTAVDSHFFTYQYNGSVQSGATWNPSGGLNSRGGYSFNNGFYNITQIDVVVVEPNPHRYSISTWVKLDSLSGYSQVLGNYNGATWDQGSYAIHIRANDPKGGDCVLRDAAGVKESNEDAQWTMGVWYNVICVFDQVTNTSRLYVNGVSKANQTTVGNYDYNQKPQYVGMDKTLAGKTYGEIDNNCYINLSLTDSQIGVMSKNTTEWPFYASPSYTLGNVESNVSDSCTPPAINNDWVVSLNDDCVLSTDTSLGTGKLIISGSGSFTVNAVLTVHDTYYTCTATPCRIVVNSGGLIWVI